MTNRTAPSAKSLDIYLRVKRLQIFSALKRLDFSGQLTWSTPDHQQWTLFFDQGQVIYGTGGTHPIRRWYRHLPAHLPAETLSYAALQETALALPEPFLPGCWDYQLLHHWRQTGLLSPEAMAAIAQNILLNLLFDVLQAREVKHQLKRQPPLPATVEAIGIHDAPLLAEVKELWEYWHASPVGRYSPNLAPVVQRPEPIQAEVSPRVFETLMQLLDGQRSLWDLAIKLGQDVLNMTQALQPYIQAGWISLEPLADFPTVVESATTTSRHGPPLIACVDDSLMICRAMEQVIRAAGYEFLSITEGEKAVPTLLAKKPDLIFLDLVMPKTNGYEICGQLRKISRFKETPVVILSGNDGLVDQVRARLLGATDFLSKPIEPIVILSVIRKHLALMTATKV